MSHYYKDEYITLYLGDCLEQQEWLAADVLVTDPPYGMNYKSRKVKESKHIENDNDTQVRDKSLELWGNKPALVFGTWRVNKPDNVKNVLIWDKGNDPGMGDLTIPWGLSHEEIYVLGKGFIGKRGTNILRANKPPSNNRPDHPTPKPISLMEMLITKTSGVIADPFAGSGSTLLAARNLSRHAIGVELDEQYCELIANRLSQQTFDFGDYQ